MSLFVLASKDGWVDIMYDGLDAVGVDQQVRGCQRSQASALFLQNAVLWGACGLPGRQPRPGVCCGALGKIWICIQSFCCRFCHTIGVARPLQENYTR